MAALHVTFIIPVAALVSFGCTDGEEAARVELLVTTDAMPFAAVTTDLGYAVTVTQMEVAVTAIQFTIEGEMHDTAAASTSHLIAPHPGHSAGGEVTGELLGDHVLTWSGDPHDPLGTATLIAGDYRGANFTFRTATAADAALSPDLVGHAIRVAGTVARAGETYALDAVFDVEPDTAVIGAVFDDVIAEGSAQTLAIGFHPDDPYEDDTAFDGVDFFTLPRAGDTIEIRPGSEAHNILRRTLQTHDHYSVTAR